MTFSIEITSSDGKFYKSIRNITWKDIPDFAVLTGTNGSGKTQLLELLAFFFSGTIPPEFGAPPWPMQINIQGLDLSPADVGFVPSGGRFSGSPGVTLAQMVNQKQQYRNQFQQPHNFRNDYTQNSKYHRFARHFGNTRIQNVDQSELDRILGDDFSFMLDDLDVSAALAYVFVAHRLRMLQRMERDNLGFVGPEKPLGPAPWDVVNESLAAAGFPYKATTPINTGLLGYYTLEFTDTKTGLKVKASDLSSGEKVLLQLILWLFTATKSGNFPKLLLLDEPDAHLHPSMTRQFLDALVEVLVRKHGVKVIMTTHSPSTVALSPDDAVFVMERGEAEIKAHVGRPEAVNLLTAGLVTVFAGTKFIFVEDEDDAKFYELVRNIISDYGPRKDRYCLKMAPSLVFLPASAGKGTTKSSGGCTVVKSLVDRLSAAPLDKIFFGLIDRDAANVATDRIKVVGRYSVENYLLDPANVYCLLLENGTAPKLNRSKVEPGDEHLLRDLDSDSLQEITDTIVAIVTAAHSALATASTARVKYTNGREVKVPSWVVERRGHDLLPIYQSAFPGGPGLVSPPRLRRALQRARLLPIELAVTLSEIQKV